MMYLKKTQVDNIKITVAPGDSKGKLWTICANYTDRDDMAVIHFQVITKNFLSKEFETRLSHIKNGCGDYNIEKFALNRHSNKSDHEFMNNLSYSNIDRIIVTVKDNFDDDKPIYKKTFLSTEK